MSAGAFSRAKVFGTNGRVLVEDGETWQAGYFNDRDREFHRTFDVYLDAMIAAFKHGEPPPVHAVAGRRALQLAMAAIESFERGRRIEVN